MKRLLIFVIFISGCVSRKEFNALKNDVRIMNQKEDISTKLGGRISLISGFILLPDGMTYDSCQMIVYDSLTHTISPGTVKNW